MFLISVGRLDTLRAPIAVPGCVAPDPCRGLSSSPMQGHCDRTARHGAASGCSAALTRAFITKSWMFFLQTYLMTKCRRRIHKTQDAQQHPEQPFSDVIPVELPRMEGAGGVVGISWEVPRRSQQAIPARQIPVQREN